MGCFNGINPDIMGILMNIDYMGYFNPDIMGILTTVYNGIFCMGILTTDSGILYNGIL